jgi:hypothetical protein
MRDLFEGKTQEEKLKVMEAMLRRISRRMQKYAVVVTPPIPICFTVQDVPGNGELFRYMFASEGKVDTIYIFAEEVEKNATPKLTIAASLLGTTESYEFSFSYGKGSTVIKKEMPIKAGTRIIVSTSEANKVKGLWFACPYVINQKGAEVQKYLLDTILASVETEEQVDAGETETREAE